MNKIPLKDLYQYEIKCDLISRIEAYEQGLLYYFIGDECSNGHIAPRIVNTKKCAICESHTWSRSWTKRIKKYKEQFGVSYVKFYKDGSSVYDQYMKEYTLNYFKTNREQVNKRERERNASNKAIKTSI